MAKVCILNTGGTIGMKPTDRGLQPESGFLEEQLKQLPELQRPEMPEFDIIEYCPVIDSANMTPGTWNQIVADITRVHDHYDGWVVLHGTDTMAYTASALAFMMPELSKPVILTGSQLPLEHIRNDARENLKTAMLMAATSLVPESCLFFGEVLLRGCRSTKISATRLDAFDSPNFPPLGRAETDIEFFPDLYRNPDDALHLLNPQPVQVSEIATFRLFPGMSVEVLKNVMERPLKALILESYGVGNGPANNQPFIEAIESAVRDGIVIVNCTQCRHGLVSQDEYAVGKRLMEAGVVSGRDMTIEATIAKLLFLISQKHTPDRIRELVELNLVGELTPP